MPSPLDALPFESAFSDLGPEFHDAVTPGTFRHPRLRYRGDGLLQTLGLDPALVTDDHLLDAFAEFRPLKGVPHPPLAQRYIGYQFQVFNPHLGDGRGFTLAQVRDPEGKLWDWGTKGSGTTPWSRGGDGRLTLKGGVREIIAAEFLHAMGVKTSRALVVIEHREDLWRGDEPSPTRASILVRMGEGHIRFGTFERVFYLERDPEARAAKMARLVDHVVDTYYPELGSLTGEDRVLALYERLLDRVATLSAHWIKAGFCHGVLNTDNMSLTGDSFDYGPFAFMEAYDPGFTAAYFDHGGLYAFERQPDACAWNLAMLTRPLSVLAPEAQLMARFETFADRYRLALRKALLPRLGFEERGREEDKDLLDLTLQLLRTLTPSYHGFFQALADRVACKGIAEGEPALPEALFPDLRDGERPLLKAFSKVWRARFDRGDEPIEPVVARLMGNNPRVVPYRREIERVWGAIDAHDDWQPLYTWLEALRAPFRAP